MYMSWYFHTQWFEVRGNCSFCWGWWNCWPSPFFSKQDENTFSNGPLALPSFYMFWQSKAKHLSVWPTMCHHSNRSTSHLAWNNNRLIICIHLRAYVPRIFYIHCSSIRRDRWNFNHRSRKCCSCNSI